jgi:hypothetical protein
MRGRGFKRAVSVPAGGDRELPPSPEQNRKRLDPAVAPTLPPTQVEGSEPVDPIAQLNLKIRTSLIDQLVEAAEREGTTQKVIVCRALAAAGFNIHPEDLANRSNHRRRRG